MKPFVDALRADAGLIATTPKELYDATGLFMSPAERISKTREFSPTPVIEERIRQPPTPQQASAAPR
jgi:hypothetical protein